jgi:DNA-binding transcriptional LysR family regulator
MRLVLDRGVPQEERHKAALGSLTDWDAARVFLEVWLSYHPGNGRIPRVRHMIDWLVEAFNPTKFPWFKDEFVHPSEFKPVYKG